MLLLGESETEALRGYNAGERVHGRTGGPSEKQTDDLAAISFSRT